MDQITAALIKSIPNVVGVLATGLVGAGLAYWWNVKLKRRELDLAAAKTFHEQYGEFFAIWKLWNYYIQDIGPKAFKDASRWKLLERACAAESRIEATFVELTSKRNLSRSSVGELGQFRQVYQQLRQSIRDNKPLPWSYSEHEAYKALKELTPRVAQIILGGRTGGRRAKQRAGVWLEVTSNKFEDFWLERTSAN